MTRNIALLIFPQFQILDATGPIAAFEIAGRIQPGAYRLRVIAAEPGPVTSSSGVALHAHAAARTGAIDTLVIAGGDGSQAAAASARVLRFVRNRPQTARRVVSVCTGAYVLAAAGLLDSRRATTHWSFATDFARRFPAVLLEPDRIFIKQGKIWTSAGITAGIDLALALIGEDLGDEIARRTARQLVMYHRRPGGQSQHSALLEMEHAGDRFAPLLDYVRANLHKPLDVAALAARACMSPRHFARAFQAETGVSPAKAVERLRAEAARGALENGRRSVKEIARAYGFGQAERMRRSFIRLYGAPPSAARRPRATSARRRASPSTPQPVGAQSQPAAIKR